MPSVLFSNAIQDVQLQQIEANTQPFNQADNYLLQQLNERYTGEKIAIIDDEYGALACALAHYAPQCFNDSAIYQYYLEQNLATAPFPTHTTDTLAQSDAQIFLLRLPKNLHYFQYLLEQLAQINNVTVIIAGMQKYWPSSFYQAAEHYFHHIEVLPGVKKAKCMVLRTAKIAKKVATTITLTLPKFDLQLINYPNVFSREQLDIGSRFFLENFPSLKHSKTALDLACGNGVLGIYAQKQQPALFMHYLDACAFALKSAENSLKINNIFPTRYQLHHKHSLFHTELPSVDTILCNPPFHQNHKVGTQTALLMIKHAATILTKEGELYLVANRHLPYYSPLKMAFKHVNSIASNNKFTLYHAQQPL